MKTCYLHLGMPKTGSSSIQDAFLNYEDSALEYAKLAVVNHSVPVFASFSKAPHELEHFQKRGFTDKQITRKVKRFKNNLRSALKTSRSVIISGEAIIDRLDAGELTDMFSYIGQHVDKIEVIIYVRPLASLLASQLQQRIKAGVLGTFEMPTPNYKKRFKPVLDIAGAENVTFVRFARSDLIGGDVVSDFAARVHAERIPEEKERKNESFSTEAIGTLYAFNKFIGEKMDPVERHKFQRQLELRLRDFGSTKFGLSKELVEQHVAQNERDIKWMENAAGFDVSGVFSPVENPVCSEDHLLSFSAPA